MYNLDLDKVAGQQDGLVTYRQACDILGASRVDRFVRSHRLIRVLWGVYRLAGVPDHPRLTPRAALLAAPRGAVLSHSSAAWVHGLTNEAVELPHVSVSAAQARTTRGVITHQTFLPTNQWSVVAGLRVTLIPRTIVDLASLMTQRNLESVVDEALATQRVRIAHIERTLDEIGRRGRKGVRKLSAVLDARREVADGARSKLELRFLRLVKREGLPLPQKQVPFGRYTLDVAWPDLNLVVELDGYGAHGTSKKRFDHDRERNNFIVASGLTLLHFTWRMSDETILRHLLPYFR